MNLGSSPYFVFHIIDCLFFGIRALIRVWLWMCGWLFSCILARKDFLKVSGLIYEILWWNMDWHMVMGSKYLSSLPNLRLGERVTMGNNIWVRYPIWLFELLILVFNVDIIFNFVNWLICSYVGNCRQGTWATIYDSYFQYCCK